MASLRTMRFFAAALALAYFLTVVVVFRSLPSDGSSYLRTEILEPVFGSLRPLGALLALLGLWRWIAVASGAAAMWALLTAAAALLVLGVADIFTPWRFWPAVLFPWLMAALHWSLSARIALVTLWMFVDSSGLALLLFFAVLAGAARSVGDRREARDHLLTALWVLLLSPLHWAFVIYSFEAFRYEAVAELAVLGWQGPRFQEEPRLALAVILLLGGIAAMPRVEGVQRAAILAALSGAVIQRRFSPLLVETASWAIALAVGRFVSERRLCSLVPESQLRRIGLYCTAVALAVTIYRPLAPGGSSPDGDALMIAIKRHEGRLHARKEKLRLFHELEYAEQLRHYELKTYVEPNWNDGAYPSVDAAALADSFVKYRTLITLRSGWLEVLAQERFNAVLVDRGQPLAGALLERERWEVAAHDRNGKALLLVPPEANSK